jgi:hypothetical protein
VGNIESMDMIHAQGSMDQDNMRFHYTTQKCTISNFMNFLIVEISIVFRPWLTMDKCNYGKQNQE